MHTTPDRGADGVAFQHGGLVLPRPRLRLLYLCDRRTFETKMSRVRFHGIQAIGRIADVVWSGPGWPGYDPGRSVQDNVAALYRGGPGPELIIGYKPLELICFADTEAPRCIRYNEMYDTDWTWREITASRSNLVVCHHRNDMAEWQRRLAGYDGHPLQLVNIAHCADERFYRDYGLPEQWDVMLVGAHGLRSMLGPHYPLRDRMVGLLQQLGQRYRCTVYRHPGGELSDATTDRNTVEFAKAINSAKICVTCSGVPRSRFGKYVEVPMCGTALAADLPGEEHDLFRQFVIEIDLQDSDEKILRTLAYWIEHDAERAQLVRRGLELSRLYTQTKYAERFVREARLFLARWHGGRLPRRYRAETDDLLAAPEPAAVDLDPARVLGQVRTLLRGQRIAEALHQIEMARLRFPACEEVQAAWRQMSAVLGAGAPVAGGQP